MTAPAISMVINQLKGYVTKQSDITVWQKGFYEHIIREERDYLDTWEYINNNPARRLEGKGEDY